MRLRSLVDSIGSDPFSYCLFCFLKAFVILIAYYTMELKIFDSLVASPGLSHSKNACLEGVMKIPKEPSIGLEIIAHFHATIQVSELQD